MQAIIAYDGLFERYDAKSSNVFEYPYNDPYKAKTVKGPNGRI